MKVWEREIVECAAVIIFATLVITFATLLWWWVFSGGGKSHQIKEKKVMSQSEKPIKI